jgi:hypothetical protein
VFSIPTWLAAQINEPHVDHGPDPDDVVPPPPPEVENVLLEDVVLPPESVEITA